MKDIAIFLCNLTLNMAQPWLDAGYTVVMVDPQHPAGLTSDGHVLRVGCKVEECLGYLGAWVRSGRVAFVAGFPPCTDVALSGTRWWADKRKNDPYFQAKAAIVAEQCRTIGELSGAPWMFENPKSAFSRIFGSPKYKFHPHQFTSYCEEDNYLKETWLWTGGGFVMPHAAKDLSLGDPDERIHRCAPSDERANFRSATPRGFAKAVFLANGRPLLDKVERAA